MNPSVSSFHVFIIAKNNSAYRLILLGLGHFYLIKMIEISLKMRVCRPPRAADGLIFRNFGHFSDKNMALSLYLLAVAAIIFYSYFYSGCNG